MPDEIAQSVEDGVKEVAEHVGTRLGPKLKEFFESTKDKAVKMAEDTAETEAQNKQAIEDIMSDGEKGAAQDAQDVEQGLARDAEHGGEPNLGEGEHGPGQGAEGDQNVTACGDPVDVVSGQMITWAVDVDLPGSLPLVLRRAYASGYRGGRMLGPGWSSTLDQRLEIDEDGVHYAGDDAQVLHYAHPDQPGRSLLPADGARWPLTYDQGTDTYVVTDPATGWSRRFGGNPADAAVRPITAMTDRNGHRITYAHDQQGVPVAIGHSGGYRISVETTYTDGGYRIEGLRLLDGANNGAGTRLVEYRYDTLGRLAGIVNSSGFPYQFEYDACDRVTAWIDRLGYRYEYAYDADGRVVRAAGADGSQETTFAYDPVNRVTTSTNSLGDTAAFHYDAHHHITKVVDPLGHAATSEYDRFGRILSSTDPLGRTVRYRFDQAGNRTAVVQPDDATASAEFDAAGLPRAVTGPDGGRWLYEHDAAGNLLAVTDPLGGRIAYGYDESGRLTQVTDALGAVTRIECNPAGLPTALIDARGGVTRHRYDAFGRVVESTDPLGGVSSFGWTVEGLRAWQQAPDGAREEFEYDAEGNLVEHRDAAGNVTRIEIACLDLPATRTEADGSRYQFGYDSELRLVSVTNPLGLVWRYAYDEAGNLAGQTDFDGRAQRYGYDDAGQLISRTLPSGRVVEFDYDLRGQITEQRCGDAVERFAYDEAGRLVGAANDDVRLDFEHDELGNLLLEKAGEHTLRNVYDAAGQRVSRTTPSGHVTQWTYDESGGPTLMSTPAGALSFEYNAAGRETARHLSAHTSITRSWDASHRLASTAVWHRPETGEYELVQAHGYRYRGDGLALAHTDALRGDRDLQLDPLGRITAATSPNRSERYSYDAAGNIASRTVGDDDDAEGPREYQGLRVTRAGRIHYGYDEDGRLISATRRTISGQQRVWRYTWDGFDRLVGVETPDGAHWRYRYDPLGRRVAKQQLADDATTILSEVLFAWDGSRLAEQITTTGTGAGTGTGTADQPAQTYSWDYLPGTDDVAAQSVATRTISTEGDRQFYAIVTDLVGTPTELLTAGGQVAWQAAHDLWGNPWGDTPSQVDCLLRFPGQYHDRESGLHYNLSRYYDPASGQYATPDPLGLEPSPHHRAYVPNPLAWIDPLGLAKCLKVTDDTMKHVRGEINRGGRPVGYHYRPGGRDRFGWRTTGKSGVDVNGCYTGTVTGKVWENNTWVEKRASSSFFPDNWSEDQVRHAITRAADNGNLVEGTNMWRGTYRGINIEGYFDPVTKHVITGYPIFQGPLS